MRLAALLGACICVGSPAAHAQDPFEASETIAATAFFGETLGGDAAPLFPVLRTAEFFGETLEAPAIEVLARGLGDAGATLFVAGHRTTAQRYSDFYLTSGKPRRRPVAASMRLRRADDRNFTNRTRFLARRVAEIGRPAGAQIGVATTGEEFLDALIAASRAGPIANLVVYGHAAPNALFMREDRGFYGSVMEVARASHIVSGEEIEKDEQLRLAGARDLSDFEQLVSRGEIKFTRNAVIVFAGCGVAGKRDIEPNSIAARMAEITGAKVIASVDVTDQSMTRGRDFRNKEYSRRSWVRFPGQQPPERLNTKVIDALQQLNFDGAAVAAAAAVRPGQTDPNGSAPGMAGSSALAGRPADISTILEVTLDPHLMIQ